jgi:hypothetical protein
LLLAHLIKPTGNTVGFLLTTRKIYGGTPSFLIDGAVFEGSSGSPVSYINILHQELETYFP